MLPNRSIGDALENSILVPHVQVVRAHVHKHLAEIGPGDLAIAVQVEFAHRLGHGLFLLLDFCLRGVHVILHIQFEHHAERDGHEEEGREGEWQEDGGSHEEGGEGHFRAKEAQRCAGGYLRQESDAAHGGDRGVQCQSFENVGTRLARLQVT